jgi:hypothetical protein
MCRHPNIDFWVDVPFTLWRNLDAFWNGNLALVIVVVICLGVVQGWWRTR